MQTPEQILEKIRALANEAKSIKNPRSYRPPKPSDFVPDVQILAFDQTLSNAGWALINTDRGIIEVVDSGTLRPAIGRDLKGFEVTFTKAVFLSRDLRKLLKDLDGRFDQVILELPSVTGYRTESSLVAAVTICVALDERGRSMPYFVSRQSAGAALAGDRAASKNLSSEVVNDLVGNRHRTNVGCWTEHVRDAVFVGLKHLHMPEESA